MSTRRLSALAAAAACALPALACVPASAATVPASATSGRIAGTDRYGTAVAVSRHRFPGRAASVYLVSGTSFADALAAGTVTDGPVLLVPTTGPVPAAVLAEIRRLDPGVVHAVGGAAVVPDATLRAAAQGRAVHRLAGESRYGTAVAVSVHVTPVPVTRLVGRPDDIALVGAVPTPDGLVAAQAARTVMPVPSRGYPPPVVLRELRRVENEQARTFGVGSPSVVPQAVLAGAQMYSRLDGTVYERGAQLASIGAEWSSSRTVYLASATSLPDSLTAGTLDDGAVVLVPSDGAVPDAVRAYLRDREIDRVVALGGPGAVSDRMLEAVRSIARGA